MTRGDEQDPHGHPHILFSNDEAASDPRRLHVNVLFGSTKRPGAPNRPFELLCDEADGFDRPTVIDCSRIYFIPKTRLSRKLDDVGRMRRAQICRKRAEVFRFVFQ